MMVFPLLPVPSAKIDTVFADRDYPKSLGIHTGWDINGIEGGDNDLGRMYNAIYPGEVVFVSEDAGGAWGGLIVVWHAGLNIFSRYAHHKPGTARVRVGDRVTAGTRLAGIGKGAHDRWTAHLHFDLLRKTPPVSRSGFRPHWALWPGKDRAQLLEYFLDPTRVFMKFGVMTPRVANERRMFHDALGPIPGELSGDQLEAEAVILEGDLPERERIIPEPLRSSR